MNTYVFKGVSVVTYINIGYTRLPKEERKEKEDKQ